MMLPLFIIFLVGLFVENGDAQRNVPTFTFEPPSGKGFQGGVIIAKCNVLVGGEKRVYFFRGSEKIFDAHSISTSVVSFTLWNLTSKNAGTYRCMYEISVPERRKSRPSNAMQLTILDIQAPLSTLRPPFVSVTEGENFHMACTANQEHKCFFYACREDRYSQSHLAQGWDNTSISVSNVRRADAGNYICYCLVELNGISAFSAPSNLMKLTVIENVPKPNITFEPTSGVGLQGGIIIVKCEVLIDGEKIVSLLTGSEKIFDVHSLSEPVVSFTLANLSSKSAKNYRCMYEMLLPKKSKSRRSDEIQLTILDVQAPSSTLRPSSAAVTEGENLHMNCRANTKHKCFFYEYSDDEYSEHQLTEASSASTISMPNVTRCDAGNYICHCLVEVNGIFAFSAPSNLMELTVIERSKAKHSETHLLVAGLVFTLLFIVLILTSAFLGICLSKKKPSPPQDSTPSATELQTVS